MKVLEHLIQDGLHECRRVCRSWKAACSKMPLRLLTNNHEHIPLVVGLFPNAASFDARLTSVPTDPDGDVFEPCLSETVFSKISHLKDLRDFSAWIKERWHFSFSPEESFRCLSKLQRFEIVLHERADGLSLLYSALRFLTRLTMLYLYTPDMGPQCLDPFTELKCIKALGVNSHLLLNQRGEYLFPPSDNLTRLMLNIDPSFRKYKYNILQVRFSLLITVV